jgi:hypothetical protein
MVGPVLGATLDGSLEFTLGLELSAAPGPSLCVVITIGDSLGVFSSAVVGERLGKERGNLVGESLGIKPGPLVGEPGSRFAASLGGALNGEVIPSSSIGGLI